MTKPGCWVVPFLLILLGAVGALALLPQRAGQCAFDDAYKAREALEAQRLENQVHAEATKTALDLQSYADRQDVKTAALEAGTMVVLFSVAILALGIPGVVVWWLWVRSQTVYAHSGMYPLMARPGRKLEVYNPNLLPGVDSNVTARAQAVQLAATMRGELTPGERRAAMHELGAVFIEQQAAPRLPPIRVMDDAAISALLESGADDEPE